MAPTLGFLGVAVGAVLKDRSDRKAALHADRMQLYGQFLRTFSEYSATLTSRTPSRVRSGRPSDLRAATDLQHSTLAELLALSTQIDLIGSRPAANAAIAALRLVARSSLTLIESIRGELNPDEAFIDLQGEMMEIMATFRDAAAADLGLSQRDRGRRSSDAAADLGALQDLRRELERLRPQG